MNNYLPLSGFTMRNPVRDINSKTLIQACIFYAIQNDIPDEGAKEIGESLRTNTTLTELN